MQHPTDVWGKVYKSLTGTWTYAVFIGTHIYLTDNTDDWRTVYDTCRKDTESLRRLLIAGHQLTKTWDEILMDDAHEI